MRARVGEVISLGQHSSEEKGFKPRPDPSHPGDCCTENAYPIHKGDEKQRKSSGSTFSVSIMQSTEII